MSDGKELDRFYAESGMLRLGGALKALSGLLASADKSAVNTEDLAGLVDILADEAGSNKDLVLPLLYPGRPTGEGERSGAAPS